MSSSLCLCTTVPVPGIDPEVAHGINLWQEDGKNKRRSDHVFICAARFTLLNLFGV